mmetsp:Transcript_9931/g.27034  ORF Transcript_9931/g.27034 Transcript_9931/m.27034 type:complete len:265 (-) Transcript_9931:208-1002(-)
MDQPDVRDQLGDAEQGDPRRDLKHDLREGDLLSEPRGEGHEADAEHPVGVALAHSALIVDVVIGVVVEGLVDRPRLDLHVTVLLVEVAVEEGVDHHDGAVLLELVRLNGVHAHEVPQAVGVCLAVRVVHRLGLVRCGHVQHEPVVVHVVLEPQLHLVELQVVRLRRGRILVLRWAPLPAHAVAVHALLPLQHRVPDVAVRRDRAVVEQGLAELALLRLPPRDQNACGDERGAYLARVGDPLVDVPGHVQVRDLGLHRLDNDPSR